MAFKLHRKTRKRAGNYCIDVVGDMSIYTAASDHAFLSETISKAKELHFNLSKVDEIDITGVQNLLAVKQWCEHHNVSFTITEFSQVIRETFTLLDLCAEMNVEAETETNEKEVAQ